MLDQKIINSFLFRILLTKIMNTEKSKKQIKKEEEGVAIPPDGGYGWVVLVAAFVCRK